MMENGHMTRRSLLRAAAFAGAALAVPFARGAFAAGKLACGFWDHWVPGANDALTKLCKEWLSELQERIECAVLLQSLPGWRGVKLHDVEIVGFHSCKTLLDPRHDVVALEDVCPPLAARRWGCAD
jgi:hypothetical protein